MTHVRQFGDDFLSGSDGLVRKMRDSTQPVRPNIESQKLKEIDRNHALPEESSSLIMESAEHGAKRIVS